MANRFRLRRPDFFSRLDIICPTNALECKRRVGRAEQAANEPLSDHVPAQPFFWLGQPLAQIEADDSYGDLICECELVTRGRVIRAITEGGAANVDDIRRETRLGMGPCQGGFCTYRAVALWDEVAGLQAGGDAAALARSGALLRHFLQERWKGLTAITWGDQLRQARLDEMIYLDTLGLDLLPMPEDQRSSDTLVTDHPSIATEYHTA